MPRNNICFGDLWKPRKPLILLAAEKQRNPEMTPLHEKFGLLASERADGALKQLQQKLIHLKQSGKHKGAGFLQLAEGKPLQLRVKLGRTGLQLGKPGRIDGVRLGLANNDSLLLQSFQSLEDRLVSDGAPMISFDNGKY